MQYVSFRAAPEHTSVGAIVGDRVMDLGSRLPVATAGLSPIRRLLHVHDGQLPIEADQFLGLPGFALSEIEVLPIVPDPSKVIAAPVNYVDHQAEMNQDAHIDALGVFLKAPSSVTAHNTTVTLPYSDRRFDQEGELALVIGQRARHVRAAEAMAYVAGYTCLLDMTMRGGEDRSTRKSFETFTPVGPYLVTPDEVGPLEDLRLRTWVNDDLRQDADIADLIWGVPALIEYASSVMTLEVGDILTTGTPAGVGQVHDGDVVSVEISRVGRLSSAVSATGATLSPTRGADRGPKPPASVTPVRQR